MIGFNMILRDEGVDPAEVKLPRHQSTGHKGRPTPYDLWIADDGRLELYQRIQKKEVVPENRTAVLGGIRPI